MRHRVCFNASPFLTFASTTFSTLMGKSFSSIVRSAAGNSFFLLTPPMAHQVAVLGTGLLGAGFVRGFRKRGNNVNVWNRTAEKAKVMMNDDKFHISCF